MRNKLMKILLAVACLCLVSMPIAAEKGGGGGNTGCAIVDVPRLSTTTTTTEPNSSVGVFGRVTNCATGKKRYTIWGSSVSSCGEKTVFASGVMSFSGGQSKSISVAYPIAPDTCRGTMTVSISAYSGDTLLSSESTTLTVQ